MSEQTWQPVDGWRGLYEVSSDGAVRHVDGREVGQWLNDQGYSIVRLSRPRAMRRVHRLVAQAFIANPESLPCINHLDNDRSNNRVSNLEWCTQEQNLAHARAQGRMPRDYWLGRRSPNARLTDEQVGRIRSEYAAGGVSWESLGKRHGLSKRAIGRLLKGETYV